MISGSSACRVCELCSPHERSDMRVLPGVASLTRATKLNTMIAGASMPAKSLARVRWCMNIQTRPDPVARARELASEIAAAGDEIERTQRFPEALLERLHDSRLFRMLL